MPGTATLAPVLTGLQPFVDVSAADALMPPGFRSTFRRRRAYGSSGLVARAAALRARSTPTAMAIATTAIVPSNA
jgi:hypothetical protein